MDISASNNRIPINYDALKIIAFGGSAVVYGIDGRFVLKEYYDQDDEAMSTECRAFNRLGSHPNIAQFVQKHNNQSIILERGIPLVAADGPLTTPRTLSQKLQWISDAAKGLHYIHQMGIIHADFSCSNLILVEEDIKIIDFGGCSIDGSEGLGAYNWYSYRRSTSIGVRSDIFACGCAVYEIMTGKVPYHELAKHPDRHKRVQELYESKNFPDVESMPLRDVILGCWNDVFDSMDDVIKILNSIDTPDI